MCNFRIEDEEGPVAFGRPPPTSARRMHSATIREEDGEDEDEDEDEEDEEVVTGADEEGAAEDETARLGSIGGGVDADDDDTQTTFGSGGIASEFKSRLHIRSASGEETGGNGGGVLGLGPAGAPPPSSDVGLLSSRVEELRKKIHEDYDETVLQNYLPVMKEHPDRGPYSYAYIPFG